MDASSAVGLIIGVILVIITVFLILSGNKKVEPVKEAVVPQKVVSAFPVAPEPQASIKVDDLTIIEGVGPKIASLLNEIGIKTFAQLAAAELPVLEKMLQDNRLQFAKPDSWPEQAGLAAEGKLDELKALQDRLVGGR